LSSGQFEVLIHALIEQQRLDHERFVVGVATAIGISLSSEALAAWQAEYGGTTRPRPPMDGQTLGAILRQFPGAIRVN
jgi:hypothetical protein